MVSGVFVSPLYIPLSLQLSRGLGVFVCLLYIPLSLYLSRGLGVFVSNLHIPLSLHLPSGPRCRCQSPVHATATAIV